MEIDPQAIEVLDELRAEPTRSDVEWLRAVGDWCRTRRTASRAVPALTPLGRGAAVAQPAGVEER